MRTRLVSGLVAAALTLAACGGGDAGGGGGDGGTAAAGAGSGETSAVPEAELLSFEAETVDGRTVDVGDYAGSDLVLWFWAPW